MPFVSRWECVRSADSDERPTIAEPRKYTALKIVRADASFAEPHARLRRARAGLAIHYDHSVRVELSVASRQLIEGNMFCARDDAASYLGVGPHIDQHHLTVALELREPCAIDLIHRLNETTGDTHAAMIPAADIFALR
jgi:hypothetical protein